MCWLSRLWRKRGRRTASGLSALSDPDLVSLQILTIEDLFAGKKPAMPPEDPAAFKRAAREEDKTRQGKLV